MNWYLDKSGNPYVGDRQRNDAVIEPRPEDGKPYLYKDGTWIEDTESENAVTKKALDEIDLKSIRSIREWLSKQADCPSYLKTHEANAQSERAKIK